MPEPGSVLLWESREQLRSENSIADLEISLPRPAYPVNYLLDGQQRLSTICGAMYWNGDNPKSRWNIAYDLRGGTFVHLDTLGDDSLHLMRLNKLPDASKYFGQVAALDSLAASDKDRLKCRADVLFNRFKDYRVATVTLGDMPLADVAPIFERINSTGTPLTIVDLMRAATWSPDFDLIDSIEDTSGASRRRASKRSTRRLSFATSRHPQAAASPPTASTTCASTPPTASRPPWRRRGKRTIERLTFSRPGFTSLVLRSCLTQTSSLF